jgi:outer membrane protein TolC
MSTLTSITLALALAQAPAGQDQAAPAPQAASPALSAPTTVLSLDQALQAAAVQNLDLQSAQARLRQADELHWKAWSGYLPQVTGTGTYLRDREAAIPAGAFGAGSPAIVIQPKEQTTAQLQLTQAILAPQLWFAIPNARRGEEIARLNVDTARREVLFGVAQVYYSVSALKRALEVSQRLLEIAQRQEKDARVRYQAGAVAKVALIRAEIERARAEQDLKRAENSLQSARLGLAALLNRAADFDVVDPPEVVLPGDAKAFEQQAVTARPELQAARLNVDVQQSNKNGALSRYLPNVGVFYQLGYSDPAGLSGLMRSWAAGVSLQWRILDGGLRESDIREASARIDEARASAASTELRTRTEVQQAWLDMESARANAAKAKEQRDLAAENQRLVDVAFRAGTATAVEQADATTQLRTAEIGAVTEGLNAQLAALRVLRAAGAFNPVPMK